MKNYTFFYYVTSGGSQDYELKSYSVNSPRFDSAFKSFVCFLSFVDSDYYPCLNYNVFNGFKTQSRFLDYDDTLCLRRLNED